MLFSEEVIYSNKQKAVIIIILQEDEIRKKICEKKSALGKKLNVILFHKEKFRIVLK